MRGITRLAPGIVGILGLTSAGCDGLFGTSGEVSVETDRLEYVATHVAGEVGRPSYGFTVVARFENRTSKTLYLGRCFPSSREPIHWLAMDDVGTGASGHGHNDRDSLRSAFSPVWGCVGHDRQHLVRPGDSRMDTLHLLGPVIYDHIEQRFLGRLTGRMRLYYEVKGCPGDGACPLEPAQSNAFSVELER